MYPLTNEELVAEIQAGVNVPDNMAQLYQQNINFIRKIALPFSKVIEMDDLMQEAYFGLINAANRFDPLQGFKFTTYAEHWIRQALQRYWQNNGQSKCLPVHVLERIAKYQKFRSDFRAIVGDDPVDQEYCAHLGITTTQLKELRSYMDERHVVSLYEPLTGTDDMTLAEVVADDYNLEESIVEGIALIDGSQTLWGAVNDLGGRYSTVIESYFKQNETLEQIADQFGTSKERVRQLKHKAIGMLRKSKRVHEAAEVYGYDCAQAYHWGFGHFKNTHTSSTEFLALKHIEQERHRKELADQAHGLTSVADITAKRIAEKTGQIPIGLKLWQEKQNELERLLQAERDRRERQEEGE